MRTRADWNKDGTIARVKVAPDPTTYIYPIDILSQGAKYYEYFGKMPKSIDDVLYTDTTLQDEIYSYIDGLKWAKDNPSG